MTVDYHIWRDFATRFAQHAWENMTEHRRTRLTEAVTDFIDLYADEEDKAHLHIGWDACQCEECHNIHGDILADRVMEYFDEYYPVKEKDKLCFYDQICCCLRSALNAAGDNNAGVIGFTVGDIRRMYDGVIPEWYATQFKDGRAVQDASDDEHLWL